MIDLLFVMRLLSGLLMILIPVGLGILLARRLRVGWRLWWIGAATFVLSQVGHIPFNALVTALFKNGWLPAPPEGWKLVFNAVFLGLSAGLWEELFRYGAYRWWAKDARSWGKGLMLGAGHGGIEAIILGGLVLFTFLQMVALRGVDISRLVPAGQQAAVQEQLTTYWSFPWYYPLVGVLERIFALTLHLSASLLVLQVFVQRRAIWLWLAVIWHALADGVTVAASQVLNPYAVEAVVGLFALGSLGIIFALRTPEPVEPVLSSTPAEVPVTPALTELPETDQNLDATRYQ